MNLIIDPNPKDYQSSLNSTLAQRLAQALGGKTKVIRLYEGDQKYFNYEYNQEWIDWVAGARRLIFPVPMWNWGIPAALKDFFDKIIQRGKLWDFNEEKKYVGFLKKHSAYIIMTSGDYFPAGSPRDFVVPYLRTILDFLGIEEVKDFRVGGVRKKNLVGDPVYLDEKTREMFAAFGLKGSLPSSSRDIRNKN